MKNSTITALNEIRQSIWCDNLSRAMLEKGELAALVAAGVSGLTSNPTIFKQAIAGSEDYDSELQRQLQRGLDPEGACEELMLRDVQEAADLLRPTFDQTQGADGYASLEVSPFLAADTAGTIAAAGRLWKRLDRPNVMIKVPATAEGIPAIKELLTVGINVNVTLIFDVEVYAAVAEAYLAALEARSRQGLNLDSIASVASFFVSRVDSICESSFEKRLQEGRIAADQRRLFWGKAGIDNSYLAYRRFQELFSGSRFSALAGRRARVQRPLWASTGTKNPEFSKTLYVEELALPDTVNTLPPATLSAVMAGIAVKAVAGDKIASAGAVVGRLSEAGLDFSNLLRELQSAGVKAFADSYRDLLAAIEVKSERLLGTRAVTA